MIFLRHQSCRLVVLAMVVMTAMCAPIPFFPTTTLKKCHHTNTFSMKAADCHNLNLGAVPHHLNKDIEVLDVSYNRIRKLHQEDFNYYSYIKILYLNENFVSDIENNTFGNLKNLEVLNLSMNAIRRIPEELFNLKSLRKLTFDHNEHLDPKTLANLTGKPPMYNLDFLSIANCRLPILPPMDKFPHITFLNVSGNNLETISPRQIAPACFLTKIDLSGNKDLFKAPGCDCIALKHWTAKKNIVVVPSFDRLCLPMRPEIEESCYNETVVDTELLFKSCKATYKKLRVEEFRDKLFYWFALGTGFISIFLLVGFCYLCVAHDKSRKKRAEQPPIALEPLNNAEANVNLIHHGNGHGYGNDGDD